MGKIEQKPRFSVKVLVILVVKVVLVVEDLVKAGTGFLSFMWSMTSYASIVSPVIHAVVHLEHHIKEKSEGTSCQT